MTNDQKIAVLLDQCNKVIDTYNATLEANHGNDLDFMLVWDNFVEYIKGDDYDFKK